MLGMPWNLTELHGWGLLGTHTALYLLERGTPPVLFEKPMLNTMRAEVRARLECLVEPYERMAAFIKANPGKVLLFQEVDLLHGLGNRMAAPMSEHLRGRRNIGVIAFEDTTLGAEEQARGHQYEHIVTHSLYNQKLLQDAGMKDVRLAWQGVDPSEMNPPPRRNLFGNRFVVFSGGKLEYRKAQDVVLEAFKRFHARHPDSVLITAWQNVWPQTGLSMAESPICKVAPTIEDNRLAIAKWAVANGCPQEAFFDLGLLNRAQVGAALAEADAAVFPNRCEGATNLVAMEAMACGVPCLIADNTGQRDLLFDREVAYPLARQTPLPNPHGARTGWCESSVDEVVANLEAVYTDRTEARGRAAKGRAFMLGERTWRKFAEVFVAECER
jgi:glycosyltransferase involved in cell wall biosynthesis